MPFIIHFFRIQTDTKVERVEIRSPLPDRLLFTSRFLFLWHFQALFFCLRNTYGNSLLPILNFITRTAFEFTLFKSFITLPTFFWAFVEYFFSMV